MNTQLISPQASPIGVRQLLSPPWLWLKTFAMLGLTVTFVLGWVLPVWHHAGWVLGFGVLYGSLLGKSLGGAEVLGEVQEFALSLPTRRRPIYRTRLLTGAAMVFGLTTLSTLAIIFNWPQAVWSLVVETGFTEPFPAWEDHGRVCVLAMTAPLTAYTAAFVLACLSRSRLMASGAWLGGIAIVGLALGIGAYVEIWRWDVFSARLVGPLMGVSTVGFALWGDLRYPKKEAIIRESRAAGQWVVAAVVVVIILFLGVLWLLPGEAPRSDTYIEATHGAETAGDSLPIPADTQPSSGPQPIPPETQEAEPGEEMER